VGINTAFPEPGQDLVFGMQGPDILDPACPPAPVVEDEQSPAAIVPADIRPGGMNRAICLIAPGLVSEEWAGKRKFLKDPFVFKKSDLVRIDLDFRVLPGILVVHGIPVVPFLTGNDMDKTQVAAAFPALETLECDTLAPYFAEW
jgi:hypothetical protein